MQENRHTIRNIDRDLIIDARIHALQTGRCSLGELVSDAIQLLIEQETIEEEQEA